MSADLQSLIDMASSAKKSTPEIDEALALYLHPELANMPRSEFGGWVSDEWGLIAPPTRYSADITETAGMIERRFVGWCWDVGRDRSGEYFAQVYKPAEIYKANAECVSHSAPTAPLALLVAFLKAEARTTEPRPKQAGSDKS